MALGVPYPRAASADLNPTMKQSIATDEWRTQGNIRCCLNSK